MQGKVEAVGQDKQGQYGPYTSVKVGGVWYTVDSICEHFEFDAEAIRKAVLK